MLGQTVNLQVFMLMHTAGLHQGKKPSTLSNHEFEENESVNGSNADSFSIDLERENLVGAVWDVLRREDVPKLNEFLRVHWREIGPTYQSHAVIWLCILVTKQFVYVFGCLFCLILRCLLC